MEDAIVKCYLATLAVGLQLKEDWVIMNALIAVHNFHSGAFREGRYLEALPSLQECFNAITAVPPTKENITILIHVCDALACALEQSYHKRKNNERLPSPTGGKKGVAKLAQIVTIDNYQELKQAEEVCKAGIGLTPGDTMVKKKLIRTLTRIQLTRAITPSLQGRDAETQVIMLLEFMKHLPESDVNKRKEYLLKVHHDHEQIIIMLTKRKCN